MITVIVMYRIMSTMKRIIILRNNNSNFNNDFNINENNSNDISNNNKNSIVFHVTGRTL